MRRSPLYDSQSRMRASFTRYHDWELAQDFGDARGEYDSVRKAAGALDVPYAGKLRATGRDRVKYLHNMLSNDIKSLSPGQGCYATLLTHQGHMEADLFVYVFDDEIWLECPPSATVQVNASLAKYIISDVVTIEDRTSEAGILSLQGPASSKLMAEIVGLPLDRMKLLEHRTVGRPEGSWVVARRDRTGCDGYDLWMPAAGLGAVWSDWIASGKVAPVGHQALNWLRTEAGIPWFGAEMDDKTLPMEMGLDHALSMTKGCYRGQEIVARVLHRGHLNRRLGALEIEAGYPPQRGDEVRIGGSKVGEVRSAIHSPALGKPLALAVLKVEVLAPETPLEVVCGTTAFPAKVVRLPLGCDHGGQPASRSDLVPE